jgi:hypothetical protein
VISNPPLTLVGGPPLLLPEHFTFIVTDASAVSWMRALSPHYSNSVRTSPWPLGDTPYAATRLTTSKDAVAYSFHGRPKFWHLKYWERPPRLSFSTTKSCTCKTSRVLLKAEHCLILTSPGPSTPITTIGLELSSSGASMEGGTLRSWYVRPSGISEPPGWTGITDWQLKGSTCLTTTSLFQQYLSA